MHCLTAPKQQHYTTTAVGDTTEAIYDATGGLGCDLVIEATNSPNAFVDAEKASKLAQE